jgi:Uma2 family endonuclease
MDNGRHMSSATKAPPITVQQYLGFESPPGFRDELINGRIIVSPEPKPLHHDVALNVFNLLQSAVGTSFKTGMRINMTMEELNSAPSPDVWVVDREKWRAARAANTYPENAPILAVEVVSPSNRKRHIREKVDLYLNTGGAAVWVVYPKRREVSVFVSGAAERRYGMDDVLLLPAPLPQRRIALADIFHLD